MLHNASASKTDHFFYCQWWASPAITLPPEPEDPKLIDDAPRFGIAFHEITAAHLTLQPVLIDKVAEQFAVDRLRLADYYARWNKTITKLFEKRGWVNRKRFVEKKIAYDPFKDTARFLESKGTRDYGKRTKTEMPGTVDLALAPEGDEPFVVIDWKSGVSSYDAEKNGQLRTLGLGFSKLLNRSNAHVAIIRIDDDFIELNEGQIGPKHFAKHRVALKHAMMKAFSTNPPLRIGPHCNYCPALPICPAHQQPLALADFDLVEPNQIAHVFERLTPAENLLKNIRKKIKNYVDVNGPVELETKAKFLQVIEGTEENLSKASVIRALGEVKGQELLDHLRSIGAIETKKTFTLRQVNDPSSRKK